MLRGTEFSNTRANSYKDSMPSYRTAGLEIYIPERLGGESQMLSCPYCRIYEVLECVGVTQFYN